MTEGIIQQVFRRHSKKELIRFNVEPFILMKTADLEKELIKEITHGIRREVNNPESDFYIEPEDAELLIKYLVGETKE